MTSKLMILLLSLLLFSCSKVNLKEEGTTPGKQELLISSLIGKYRVDSKGGLFNNIKWYSYESESHLIWPLFDLFYIKTPHGKYIIQLRSYYDEATSEADFLKIGIKDEKKVISEITLNARGCGNPYTNPDYQTCIKDPQKNIFTYLNLETLESKQMTDEESLIDSEWDIAFKGVDVKLNGGTSGPSSVVGGLGKRMEFFFEHNKNVNYKNLKDKKYQEKAQDIFKNHTLDDSIGFYLPDGIDRVIHEMFWYKEKNHLREEKEGQWWVLKSFKDNAYIKLNIDKIFDVELEDNIETEVLFKYFLQNIENDVFSSDLKQISLKFSTKSTRSSFCINTFEQKTFKCSRDNKNWDLKLVILNKYNDGKWKRTWNIYVSKGAYGPLSTEEADKILSGRKE